MKQFFNYQKMIKDLYKVEETAHGDHKHTLRICLDHCVHHFLEEYHVPYERQTEFLTVMFPDCPKAVAEYKLKKFI